MRPMYEWLLQDHTKIFEAGICIIAAAEHAPHAALPPPRDLDFTLHATLNFLAPKALRQFDQNLK